MSENPEMKIVIKPLDEIIPYENNPRDNRNAIKDTATSIRKYGWKQPIVIDKNGVIVVGHTRYAAAKMLGLTHAPCVVSELSDKENREYRIADNKTNEASMWDFSKLEKEMSDAMLDFKDFDFQMPTFDIDELDSLFSEAPPRESEPPAPAHTYLYTPPEPAQESTDEGEPDEGEESYDFPSANQVQCPHCGKWFTLPQRG